MRKINLLLLFLPGVLVFYPSCKKESHDIMVISTPDETISVKIASNQPYQMDLTDAGIVSISKQAIHFLVSETMVNNETGAPVYKYVPATDFTGNDEIVLLSTKTVADYSTSTGGTCPGGPTGYTTSTSIKHIRLKITVGN
jgi:hypothetical protein